MKLYISHTSALEFWRMKDADSWHNLLAKSRHSSVKWPTRSMTQTPADVSIPQQIERLFGADCFPQALSLPLHLMAPRQSDRRKCSNAVWHTCAQPLPQHAFIKMNESTYIASPELTILCLAQSHSVPQVIQHSIEFCGRYRIAKDTEEGFISGKPLTTPKSIERFQQSLGPVHGESTFRKTLPFIRPNSESPMETVLYLMLCINSYLGSYALPRAELNKVLTVRVKTPAGYRTETRRCDLFWPKAMLGVEYESYEHHAGSAQLARDSKRRGELQFNGITVITVTEAQVGNVYELDKVAAHIAKILGIRLRIHVKEWRRAQMKLITDIRFNND